MNPDAERGADPADGPSSDKPLPAIDGEHSGNPFGPALGIDEQIPDRFGRFIDVDRYLPERLSAF